MNLPHFLSTISTISSRSIAPSTVKLNSKDLSFSDGVYECIRAYPKKLKPLIPGEDAYAYIIRLIYSTEYFWTNDNRHNPKVVLTQDDIIKIINKICIQHVFPFSWDASVWDGKSVPFQNINFAGRVVTVVNYASVMPCLYSAIKCIEVVNLVMDYAIDVFGVMIANRCSSCDTRLLMIWFSYTCTKGHNLCWNCVQCYVGLKNLYNDVQNNCNVCDRIRNRKIQLTILDK
jgi:hypothetical protein